MTWIVKSEGSDGKVASTVEDGFEAAFELRQEFLSKGIKAWVETIDGQLVGYTVISEPVSKAKVDATGLKASNAPPP